MDTFAEGGFFILFVFGFRFMTETSKESTNKFICQLIASNIAHKKPPTNQPYVALITFCLHSAHGALGENSFPKHSSVTLE